MSDYEVRGNPHNELSPAPALRRSWDFRVISQNITATVVSTALVASVGGWYHFSDNVDANTYAVQHNADLITHVSGELQQLSGELAEHIIYSRSLHVAHRDHVDREAEKLDARLRQCQERVGALHAVVNNRIDF